MELDHLLVPSRDSQAAAALLATLLGVPWGPSAAGPFQAVYVSAGLTLDFDQLEAGAPCPILHYAFRVSDTEFDAVLGRLVAEGIACRSLPYGPADGGVNTRHGGRIVYWSEPDSHVWEMLTRSYARQPGAPTDNP